MTDADTKHIDSHLHVRGESQYVDDVPPPPGMLHAAVFGSPVAHGTITRLAAGAARTAPGVVAVLTAADIPGVNRFGPIIEDEQLLVEREVCFIGHPIALVVARTAHQARQARELIEVAIDGLPVVVDPREAYAHGDLIHPQRTMAAGDVAAAWSDCDVVVEGRCEIGGQEHLYLETQRTRAVPREDGAMQVFSSTQGPAAVQHVVAAVLGRPMHKVEVDVKRLGGGFGGKEDQATHWAAMAALAADRLQAPVELVLNRLDDIRMTGKRHPYSADFKIGLTAAGKIRAFDATFYQNSGAFADLSSPVLARTLFHAAGAYFIPNMRVTAAACRTNLQPHTAFRGFGGPQGMYVIEAAINKAADAMGIDAAEIQRANLLRDGDRFHYGQVAERCRAERTWDELAAVFGVSALRQRVAEHNRHTFAVKKGCAMMPVCFGISFTKSHLNQGNALVHVYTDGSVGVTTGGIEMGQGISSNVAAVVARTFGIARRRVRVESTNTTRVANMSPSAASATTDLNGNAAIIAVDTILAGMREVVAAKLDAAEPSAVSVVDEQVHVAGAPAGMSWTELVDLTYHARKRLSAHGYYTTPGIHYDEQREHGHPFAYHVYGTAVFEVTVDCLRGTYAVDQVKIVHDLGRTINPTVDRGQVEGGLAQGMGWMTMEDLQWDADGRCLSHALSTYKAPDVYFMPDDMAVQFLEPEHNPHGPLGAKAVGEPPLMYGIGVYFALRNAIKAFRPGADVTLDTPMTPERLLLALHRG
jgi:xanthine dehydrogenase large subunit